MLTNLGNGPALDLVEKPRDVAGLLIELVVGDCKTLAKLPFFVPAPPVAHGLDRNAERMSRALVAEAVGEHAHSGGAHRIVVAVLRPVAMQGLARVSGFCGGHAAEVPGS